jgi:hypothetical protein
VAKVCDEEDAAVLTSGELSVRATRGDEWRIEFSAAGRTLTSSGAKGMGFMTVYDKHYVRDKLSLGVGDVAHPLWAVLSRCVRRGDRSRISGWVIPLSWRMAISTAVRPSSVAGIATELRVIT